MLSPSALCKVDRLGRSMAVYLQARLLLLRFHRLSPLLPGQHCALLAQPLQRRHRLPHGLRLCWRALLHGMWIFAFTFESRFSVVKGSRTVSTLAGEQSCTPNSNFAQHLVHTYGQPASFL